IMPVTRGVDRHEVKLDKGVHTFRFRMNQYSGPWQAYMMIRSKDDDLSTVVGLPLEKAGGDGPKPEPPKNVIDAPK
ncbi:MAG TPA: hypothetical protein VL860_11555, partial [Planctomycetota bacterium]|nr:hypothetical protein [Planctomycetota bacterium]